MESFIWSKRSLRNLEGIHPDLRKVCDLALKLSKYDFIVVEGLRTIEQQRIYVSEGKSQTMNSRHLTGHAVDFAPIVNGNVTWTNVACKVVANAFKAAAEQLGIQITWGGDWKGFVDADHIELDHSIYA